MANMKNQPSEFQIQMDFHQWCLKNSFIILSWHVPNGILSTPKSVREMKLIGLTRGIPDYWIILRSGKIITIEFKSSKGKESDEQKRIGDILTSVGINHFVCKSCYEAANLVKDLIEKERVWYNYPKEN